MNAPPPRPARSRARRAALACVLVLLSLSASELAARGFLLVTGRRYDPERTRVLAETWLHAATAPLPLPGSRSDGESPRPRFDESRLLVHPYFGWEQLSSADLVEQDTGYYRSEAAEENFDICLLGGSVAGMFGQYGAAPLIEALVRDPRLAGRRIRVYSHARAAYKQPQQLFMLGYLLALGHRPDAVLEIDGFNETALALENSVKGVHPLHPPLFFWHQVSRSGEVDEAMLDRYAAARAARAGLGSETERFLASGAWRSCVLGKAGLLRLEMLRRRSVAAQTGLAAELAASAERRGLQRGPPPPQGELEQLAEIVRVWEESSVSMAALCAGRGIHYVQVLQPTLHDTGSKTWTAEETRDASLPEEWIEGARVLYPLLRAAAPRLRSRGVAFLDASLVFREEPGTLYYDGCHFGKRGNELLADAIAPALLEAIARAGAPAPEGQPPLGAPAGQ